LCSLQFFSFVTFHIILILGMKERINSHIFMYVCMFYVCMYFTLKLNEKNTLSYSLFISYGDCLQQNRIQQHFDILIAQTLKRSLIFNIRIKTASCSLNNARFRRVIAVLSYFSLIISVHFLREKKICTIKSTITIKGDNWPHLKIT